MRTASRERFFLQISATKSESQSLPLKTTPSSKKESETSTTVDQSRSNQVFLTLSER
jgi:hypothetical protein